MKKIIHYLLIIILATIIIPASAQTLPLTVNTDKSSYYANEQVKIFGQAIEEDPNNPVTILIMDPSGKEWIKVVVSADILEYQYITKPLPAVEGEWSILVEQFQYTAKTTFKVTIPTASIIFDKERYIIGDTATITLTYNEPNDENIDSKDVIVWSSSDKIIIPVIETGNNTNIFTGKILFIDDANNENELKVDHGDVITASYSDQYTKAEAKAQINNLPVIEYEIIEDDTIIIDASKSYDLDNDILTFRWELVDGYIDYIDNNTWIEFEPNNVIFRIIVNDGYESVSEDISIRIDEQIFPIMTVKIDAISKGYEDFDIPFNAQVSGGKEPYLYTWNIDGYIINDKSFVRSFDNGIYNISLTIEDSEGNQARDSKQLSILKPIIKIEGEKQEGSEIKLSVEPIIEDVEYSWNIENENIKENDIVYRYDNDGIYEIKLTISYLDQIRNYEEEIIIENIKPNASLVVDKNRVTEGEKVRFTINIDDPGNDTFTVILYSNDKPIFESETRAKSLTYEHLYDKEGEYEHYVIINDGKDEGNSKKILVISETNLMLPMIGAIVAAGAGSTAILYKFKKSNKELRSNMEIEYEGGIEENIRFNIDIEGGIEE